MPELECDVWISSLLISVRFILHFLTNNFSDLELAGAYRSLLN